jgi:hypothetical protein
VSDPSSPAKVVVTYTVVSSADASLLILTVSVGTLSPAFNATDTIYTVNVANSVTSIAVTGTANHANATVSGNETNKSLVVGNNVVSITVTAENGTTTKTYTVTVVRAASNDATLNGLTVSVGTLSPAFNAADTVYTVNVANSVTSIAVTGTANHANATVSGNETNKSLVVGNNVVSITVTAENGTTTKTYTVTVVRAASNDATLNGLTVSVGKLEPAFDFVTTSYTVNVSNSATSIDVNGTANHAAATVSGNGTKPLDEGSNPVYIIVTAENGTIKTYTVTVVRDAILPGTGTDIVSIIVNDKELSPEETTIEYVADCDEDSVALDLEVSPYATVKIDGVEYTGQDIPLVSGAVTAHIQVVAETGGAVQNYTLKATKAIDESKLYYQRWSDVIAINRNPATNGGYNVEELRWYGNDGSVISAEGYIRLLGRPASDYYAEIKVASDWRHVCGTVQRKGISAVKAYPNPVSRGETVKLELPDEFVGGYLNIFGINGELVKSKLPLPLTDNSIDVLDLPSGVYLFKVTSKTGDNETVKIIIE